MFVQVKLLVLVMRVLIVLSMFIEQNLLVLVIFLQVNLFVETMSSNSVSAINVHPTKFIKASNMCSGKPVCRNNVRSSKPICKNNVCQSKPINVNILPCKPVLTDHTYHVDSSILSQQLFFIFFLSILIFSVYYKFSIITMNIFTNLLLAIVILLSKLTCIREFFIMFISRNSTLLRFSFKYIYHFSIMSA